jgi:hypothetical protein
MSQRQKFRLRLLVCQSEREPTRRGLPTSPVRSSVEQEVRRPELKPDPPPDARASIEEGKWGASRLAETSGCGN